MTRSAPTKMLMGSTSLLKQILRTTLNLEGVDNSKLIGLYFELFLSYQFRDIVVSRISRNKFG